MSIKIALAGNPNSGKTTLFNGLTGSNQYVGNWPGVTVEKKEGRLKGQRDVIISDLPGIYSLSPYTPEEVVSRNYLVEEKPDAILNIVDGTNLERNLYLTTQLAEVGVPMVIALNMSDLLEKRGDTIDVKKLSSALGCPVIEISALKGTGIKSAAQAAIRTAQTGRRMQPLTFAGEVEQALSLIEEKLRGIAEQERLRWYAIKLFERDEKAWAKLELSDAAREEIQAAIKICEQKMDDDSQSIITDQRYTLIGKLLLGVARKKAKGALSASDQIDRVVTNRWLALPIFAVVMFLVYYVSVTTVGDILTNFTNDTLFGAWIGEPLRAWLTGIGTKGWLVGLVVDGIIGGVGAVLGFVPQMLVLFFFLALLEDCGYMARIAFIMDRLFRKFGLSGKSFIPMLIGSGCGVPGIMAARTIENDRDRKMTIMTTTFMPCGAKMPIVALMAGSIFGGAWWVGRHRLLGHHPEEDQDVCRRALALCPGASCLSPAYRRRHRAQRMGAGLVVHQKSGQHHPAFQHCHLAALQLWHCGRRPHHDRGNGCQPAGKHRQCVRVSLRPAGLWHLAVLCGHGDGAGGEGRGRRRIRRALWRSRGCAGAGGGRSLWRAGRHRSALHRAFGLFLPALQSALRALFCGYRRDQAGNEQR